MNRIYYTIAVVLFSANAANAQYLPWQSGAPGTYVMGAYVYYPQIPVMYGPHDYLWSEYRQVNYYVGHGVGVLATAEARATEPTHINVVAPTNSQVMCNGQSITVTKGVAVIQLPDITEPSVVTLQVKRAGKPDGQVKVNVTPGGTPTVTILG
jgi:hypothetical protein